MYTNMVQNLILKNIYNNSQISRIGKKHKTIKSLISIV